MSNIHKQPSMTLPNWLSLFAMLLALISFLILFVALISGITDEIWEVFKYGVATAVVLGISAFLIEKIFYK